MALWGNKDLVTEAGTISIAQTNGLVTGNATQFVTAGVSTGNVFNIGVGATYGFAVVKYVDSETSLTVTTDFLADEATLGVARTTDVPAGTAYVISEEPLYAMADSVYSAPEVQTGLSTNPVTRVIYGVDKDEVGVAATTPYAVTHSGWVGIMTYIDGQGNLRVKHEVLVAGGISTTADNTAEDLI